MGVDEGGLAGPQVAVAHDPRLHLGGEASLGWNLGDYSLIEFIAYAGMDWTDSARLDIGYRSIAFDMNATTNDGAHWQETQWDNHLRAV